MTARTVKVYQVDQETGVETFLHWSLISDIEMEEADRFEFEQRGRVWIGGGAAPLFLVLAALGESEARS